MRAVETVKVPVRHTVDRGDACAAGSHHAGDRGRGGRQPMRLDRDHDIVLRPGFRRVGHTTRTNRYRVVAAMKGQSVLAHRRQMGTAGNKGDIDAGRRQPGAEQPADRAGSEDPDPQGISPSIWARPALSMNLRRWHPWEFFQEVDAARNLESGQARRGEFAQFGFPAPHPLPRDDCGGHLLPQHGMRNGEGQALRDGGMIHEHGVDFQRADLFASAVDLFLDPAGQTQITLRVQPAFIAGIYGTNRWRRPLRWPRGCFRTR